MRSSSKIKFAKFAMSLSLATLTVGLGLAAAAAPAAARDMGGMHGSAFPRAYANRAIPVAHGNGGNRIVAACVHVTYGFDGYFQNVASVTNNCHNREAFVAR